MTENADIHVAIQGVRASFHDAAARKYFEGGQIQVIECATFRALCESLSEKVADYAVMAIENSIAGCILPNYVLLEEFGFRIIGETYLRIEMNLMTLPGTQIGDIQTVQSHPMAFLQCEEFLARHPGMKRVETSDTAESAKDIAALKLPGAAAIASRLAAETYGLEILQAGIETNPRNFTRFLVIRRNDGRARRPDHANKSSIRFQVAHEPGSLARVLEVLSRHSVNLTQIQSLPILGKPYQYGIHVDLEWDDRAAFDQALVSIASQVVNLVHFGEYARGEWR